jgi:hypothetical protein
MLCMVACSLVDSVSRGLDCVPSMAVKRAGYLASLGLSSVSRCVVMSI